VKSITVLIVSSNKDIASINIEKWLLEQTNWDEIDTFNGNPVYRHSTMKDVIITTIRKCFLMYEKYLEPFLEMESVKS